MHAASSKIPWMPSHAKQAESCVPNEAQLHARAWHDKYAGAQAHTQRLYASYHMHHVLM